VCQPGRVIQEVSVQLPEGIAPKELPTPIHASAADFEFTREWSRHEQTIVERCELRSTVGGGACSPATITAVANAVEEIRDTVNPTLRFERSNGKND
jgi:predicted RNA-binding protein